jgi:hypothetical protein
MRDRPLTLPDALAAAVVTTLAGLIAVAYIWGRLAPLSPFALLGFAIATGVIIAVRLSRQTAPAWLEFAGVAAVFVVVMAWLLRLAWPALLPTGGGADLTHHLQLVDYLERHWRLPDASLEPVLAEMTHYTPGLHLVAALAGAWSRTSGLHAIYLVVAFAVALKLAIVFLIALRLLPEGGTRLPLALAAVVLAAMPQVYFLDSFVRDSFLAQVFAELFAVAMWWALVVWDAGPSARAMILFAAAGVGAFLTWPLWIGPPMVAAAATALVRGDLAWRDRFRHFALAAGPILVIAALHFAGRAGWVRMAATSGGVVEPSIAAFGKPFVVIAVVGVLASLRQRQTRTTLLLVLAIAVQSATLFAIARSAGAATPYMAYKMFYLLVYPIAVLAAAGIGAFLKRTASVAWVLLLIAGAAEWEQVRALRLRQAVVSRDLDVAGRWARANMEAACFEYLVSNADTAYWLHLAVLGNPRLTSRTGNNDTFDPSRNVLRWLQPGGLPYAIVHVPTASKDVFEDADRLADFGTAAVLRRSGPASCPDAQRFARVTP